MSRFYRVLFFIFAFGACGITAISAGGATEGAVTAEGTTVAPGPFGAYTPTITVRSVRGLPSMAEYRPGDDIHNNVWTRDIEDKLGIRVVYDWVAETGQMMNRLNLMLAAGDLPDFFTAPSPIFAQLVDARELADILEAYDTYATPELKAGQDAFPEGFESGMYDGQLLGLSTGFYNWISMGSAVWLRSDWMEKYDLSPPTTMDDVVDIMETFVRGESHRTDEIFGVSLSRELFGGVNTITPIANAFHAYPRSWIRNTAGEIVYGSIQPEMKEVLRVLSDWYRRGLISREFGVKDVNAANADIVAGRVGVVFGAQWLGWYPLDQLVREDPDAVFKPYTLPTSDGTPVRFQVDWPLWGYHVVSRRSQFPEAMIKIANLYNKYQFHGTDEEFMTFSDGGEYAVQRQLSPVEVIDPRQEIENYRQVSHALRTGDDSDLIVSAQAFYENARLWRDNQDPAGFGRYIQMGPYGSYAATEDQVNQGLIMLTELRGPDPTSWARDRSVLDTLEADTFVRIIIGDAPIDAFDRFVRDWLSLGGEAATEEINAIYR